MFDVHIITVFTVTPRRRRRRRRRLHRVAVAAVHIRVSAPKSGDKSLGDRIAAIKI